jgi:hypothetical protein
MDKILLEIYTHYDIYWLVTSFANNNVSSA